MLRAPRIRLSTSKTAATNCAFQSSRPRIELFWDGGCPVCVKEIGLLKSLDTDRRMVKWTDIQDPNFVMKPWRRCDDAKMEHSNAHADSDDKSSASCGTSDLPDRATLMARIHARDLQTGALFKGCEAFRVVTTALGSTRFDEEARKQTLAPEGCDEQQQAHSTPKKEAETLGELPNPRLLARIWYGFWFATGLPGTRQIADAAYNFWAEHRLKSRTTDNPCGSLTGSCSVGSASSSPKK